MGPHEAVIPQATTEAGSDSRNETSHHSRSHHPHTTSLRGIPSTAQIAENHKGDGATMPTSLTSLPSRGQPFPFILPQPLGPLSSPPRGLDQADLATGKTGLESSDLLGTHGLPGTWGSLGVNPVQSGGPRMLHQRSAPTTDLTRHLSLENIIAQRLTPPHHVSSREFENQHSSQSAANRWHEPTAGTHFPPRREVYASLLERPSAGGTGSDKSEVVQYHKCDECHEAFTTSSWLKRHKTKHFQRFRCGCGAAYIDKVLLLEHQNNKECEQRPVDPEVARCWGT